MRLSLENIQKVIISTAVLHNICRINNLQETPAEVLIPFQAMDDDDLQTMGVQDSRDRAELIEAYFSTL